MNIYLIYLSMFGLMALNIVLIVTVLQQSIRNREYKHQITQILITLNQTRKILKRSNDERERQRQRHSEQHVQDLLP
jgi:hypothetical protein